MVGIDGVVERFQFFKIKRHSGLTEQNRRNNDVHVSYDVRVAYFVSVVEIAYVAHNRYVQDVQAFEETQGC
jgi:hypothetical protein